ncbi:HXXEE domain-containing protein [Risungbinella massiliensis]|uniref:HXXEE domain-containing protein n=1 Tax=Risungbinella massiliensis TaxID=1329796 RepID=UPI0005CBEC29|nr:HXXEE domain-containing protein [Risungbinella massiliensis]
MFSISFLQLQWLFPVIVTLHNLEEAIWLPGWSKKAGKWHVKVGKREFQFAVVVLTVLAYGLTYLSWSTGPESIWTYLNCGYMLAMLLNVFFPHLLATMVLRQYAPGVVTGILINLPINFLLLSLAFQEKWFIKEKFLLIAPITVLAILLSIPVLFFLGRKIFGTE